LCVADAQVGRERTWNKFYHTLQKRERGGQSERIITTGGIHRLPHLISHISNKKKALEMENRDREGGERVYLNSTQILLI
jgi:hypothetical protein